MEDAGDSLKSKASTKEGKESFLRAERFSPRYFRNLGAGVVAGWVCMYGVAHATMPKDRLGGLSLNPMNTAGALYDFVDEDGCNTKVYGKPPRNTHAEQSGVMSYDSLRDSANRLGFDLAPAGGHIARIDSSKSYEQIATVLNDYTEEGLGFKTDIDPQALSRLQLLPKAEATGGFLEPFLVALLSQGEEFRNFKNGSKELLEQLQTVPKQLTELGGVKRLSFDAPEYDYIGGQKFVRLGAAGTGSTEILMTTLNLTGSESGRVFLHELSHKIDQKICGRWGMERDEQYASRNTFGFSYGKYGSSVLKYNAVSWYSQVSVTEDKAEMSAELLDGFDFSWLVSQPDTVRFKAGLTLARLESKLPGITRYLQLLNTYKNSDK